MTTAAAIPPRRAVLAQWLFRHRGTTAVPFALLAVIGAEPSVPGIVAGALLIGAGEWLRLAAASAIGSHSRGLSLRAPRLVTDGPYAWMRHPLYFGNAVVCAGILIFSGAFLPWMPLLFVPAFLFQYGMFIEREEQYLARQWGPDWDDYCRRVPRLGLRLRRRAVAEDDAWARAAECTAPRPAARRLDWTITAAGRKLEWPTIRTILGLIALIMASAVLRGKF